MSIFVDVWRDARKVRAKPKTSWSIKPRLAKQRARPRRRETDFDAYVASGVDSPTRVVAGNGNAYGSRLAEGFREMHARDEAMED